MTEECCAGRNIVKGVVGATVSANVVEATGSVTGIFCHVVADVGVVALAVRYKLYETALAILGIVTELLGVADDAEEEDVTGEAMDSDPSV